MAISWKATGPIAHGTGSISVQYPLGIVVGEELLLTVVSKYPPSAPITPAGFVFGGQAQGGHGFSGADAGQTTTTIFTRVADGTEAGLVTVTVPAGNSMLGVMFRYQNTISQASGWGTFAFLQVAVNAVSATWTAVTGSDIGLQAGDVLICVSGVNSDLFTFSSEAVSCSGATFSAGVERLDSKATDGDDCCLVVSEHAVLTGPSSGVQTFTMTAPSSSADSPAGGTVFMRLREVVNYSLIPDTATFTITRYPVTFSYSGAVKNSYVLANDKVRVTFADSDTYGIVIQSIENLADPAKVTFSPQPLFRVIMRAVGTSDLFITLQPENATTHAALPIGYDGEDFHLGSSVEDPPLGGRAYFQHDFFFTDIGGSTDDLKVSFTASILDDEPDRILFALYFDPTYGDGQHLGAVFWAAPILLATSPYASQDYLIGVNGGLVTRNPQTDLLGNGSTYRFNTAMGFEPETKAAAQADKLEVFYPESASMALSAYGDRSLAGAVVYVHDPIQFTPRRIVDTYDGLIRLEHEGLVENAISAGNLWTIEDPCFLRAIRTYVRVFKRKGPLIGEEVGLDYQKWALASATGQGMLPAKVRDRDDMATLRNVPLCVTAYPQDDEGETGLTDQIAKEIRLAFPAHPPEMGWLAAGGDEIRLTAPAGESMNAFFRNKASATHPGLVGDSVPDLWDLAVDAPKITRATTMLSSARTLRGGFLSLRRPTPYDGLGIWDGDNLTNARVKNHLEAAAFAYKTTDHWLRFEDVVASTSFDGTFTKVTFVAGAAAPQLWSVFSIYALTTAGINHAGHQEHLGWVSNLDGSYAFPMERQNQADFIADPPAIRVPGNQTATILAGHTLLLSFESTAYIPGFALGLPKDQQPGTNAGTSLCSYSDDIGTNTTPPDSGFGFRFRQLFETYFRPWGALAVNKFSNRNLVCWGNHGSEIPGTNNQLLAMRRIIANLRASFSQPFSWMEWTGPYDWLVGLVDGHAKTNIRLDLTTSVGSWGASPLFQTAWQPYCHAGIYSNGGAGHVSNIDGFYATFWEGTGSKKVFRETLVSDFMLGKLPTLSISPNLPDVMGIRPDGKLAFTPFYHSTYPMTVASSFAALLARLIQFHLNFNGVQVDGQRLRSFERTGTATITYNPQLLPLDGHNLPPTELGPSRAPLFHAVFLDDSAKPRLIAFWINDQQTTVGDNYAFHADWYPETFLAKTTAYTVTQWNVNYNGISSAAVTLMSTAFSLTLGPGEMTVLVIEPTAPTNPVASGSSASGICPA